MLEKEMEDLLASFPEDFFPNRRLKLKGRQQSLAEGGRFDLLFEDEHGWLILMELKAGTLKYDDASQVARYFDELHSRGQSKIIMWLIAPHIPISVRQFLDDKGIQYDEIHISQFRLIARKHGYVIASEAQPENVTNLPPSASTKLSGSRPRKNIARSRVSPVALVPVGPEVTTPSALRWKSIGYDLVLATPESLDRPRFMDLVERFEAAGRNKNASLIRDLRKWAENPGRNRLPQETIRSLLRWTTTTGPSYRSAVPAAEPLWTFLFGTPAPAWYWWEISEREYKFDPDAWKVWLQSLDRAPAHLERIFREHNTDKPHTAVDMQCQCDDCKAYRACTMNSAGH